MLLELGSETTLVCVVVWSEVFPGQFDEHPVQEEGHPLVAAEIECGDLLVLCTALVLALGLNGVEIGGIAE